MPKTIEIDVKVKSDEAKKGFDGVEVSAKDLQDRIAQLDAKMKELIDTQGRQAYESKTGLMVQRERKYALEQLITLQDKEEEGIRRSTRGYGSLASSLLATTTGTTGLSREVGILTTSLMSGAGLTAGLAMAIGLFKALTEESKKAKDEITEIGKNIQSLIQITEKKGAFNIPAENISQAIDLLRSQIRRPGFLTQGMTLEEISAQQSLNNEIFNQNSILLNAIKILEDEQKAHEDKLNIIERLSAAGLTYTEQIDKETEAIIKKDKALSQWRRGTGNIATGDFGTQGLEPSRFQFRTDLLAGTDFSQEQLRAMQEAQRNMEEMYRERARLESEFTMRTASVFTSNMTQAWRNIFGEANSMFEQLMQSWAQMFFQQVGTSLIGSLTGGIGDIFGFSRAVSGGNATAEKYRVGG